MSRVVLIVTLIIAGEMAFGLPFHLARFFRPTMIEVFGLSFTDLGIMFAFYGAAAIAGYFPGGALADRYQARTLLAGSLIATAIGGAYLTTMPGKTGLNLVYLYWGVTTVFLFWGALIRATREWGGHNAQGIAFGMLEAGRGLMAVGVAWVAVSVFGSLMPDDAAQVSDAARREAFRVVIYIYVGMALLGAALVWLFVPVDEAIRQEKRNPLRGMIVVLQRPVVWAQAIIIVCAYCAFKGTDNYGVYAKEVLGMGEVEANRFTTYGGLLRPVGAVVAGLIADRFDAARSIGVLFVVLTAMYLPLVSIAPEPTLILVIYVNIFVTYFAVFALRGIYFALLEQNGTPARYTGAAVGLVSVIGYTPDFFFGLITGPILDANPGLVGFQNYFLLLAGITVAGASAVGWLLWLYRSGDAGRWPARAAEIKT